MRRNIRRTTSNAPAVLSGEFLWKSALFNFFALVVFLFALVFLISLNTITAAQVSALQKTNNSLKSQLSELEANYIQVVKNMDLDNFAQAHNMQVATKFYLRVDKVLTQR